MQELREVQSDPEPFLLALSEGDSPLATKLQIGKARPTLEPALRKRGVEWEDMIGALEALDATQRKLAASEYIQ